MRIGWQPLPPEQIAGQTPDFLTPLKGTSCERSLSYRMPAATSPCKLTLLLNIVKKEFTAVDNHKVLMAAQRQVAGFVAKLNFILQEPQYQHIICWEHPEIIIRDRLAFVEEVLPNNFRHNKFESFIRQLNLYGFHKVLKKDPAVLSFKHPLFVPGNDDALAKIQLRSKLPPKEDNVKIQEETLSDSRNRALDELCSSRNQLRHTLVAVNNKIKTYVRENPMLQAELKEANALLKLCITESTGFVPTLYSMLSLDSRLSL